VTHHLRLVPKHCQCRGYLAQWALCLPSESPAAAPARVSRLDQCHSRLAQSYTRQPAQVASCSGKCASPCAPLQIRQGRAAGNSERWQLLLLQYEEEIETDAVEDAADDEADDENVSEVPQFRQAPVHDAPLSSESPLLATKPKKFGKKIELPLSLLTSRSGKPTSGDIKNNQEITGEYKKFSKFFKLNDSGILVYQKHGQPERVVVPKNYIDEIIHDFHSIPICGHFGTAKTIKKLRKKYFWLKFNSSIIKFIRKCDVCQKFKSILKRNRAHLNPIFAHYPFQLIHIDVVGPLTRTIDGNRYIIVVIDHFSKFIEAIAVKDFTSLTTAKFIVNQIISRYGTPRFNLY